MGEFYNIYGALRERVAKKETLAGDGTYPAAILEEEPAQNWLAHVRKGSVLGYPSFEFTDQDLLYLELSGKYAGDILVTADESGKKVLGEIDLEVRNPDWQNYLIPIAVQPGKSALYLHFNGDGELKFKSFGFFSM